MHWMNIMPTTRNSGATRKACNLSLDRKLLEEAKALGLSISRAAEAGVAEAVRRRKSDIWREENGEALRSSNTWAEANGLPLAKHRQF
jgi:antitoxin CcdA